MREGFILFGMGMEVGVTAVEGCLLVWSWEGVYWGGEIQLIVVGIILGVYS